MFKIQNEYHNANIPRTVRFTEKIFDNLMKVAYKNGISFHLLVLQCCRFALEQIAPNEK